MQLFTADSGLFEVSFQLIEKKERFLMSSVFLVFFFCSVSSAGTYLGIHCYIRKNKIMKLNFESKINFLLCACLLRVC